MGFFRRLFRQKPEPDTPEPEAAPPPRESPSHLSQPPLADPRVQRAVESILDNEALTQDLDDAAANALISWGTSWAESLARTAERSVEPDLDEATLLRLREVRRMMRSVSKWAASQAGMDPAGKSQALKEILEYASRAQGVAASTQDIDLEAWSQQLEELDAQPEKAVSALRQLVESKLFPL